MRRTPLLVLLGLGLVAVVGLGLTWSVSGRRATAADANAPMASGRGVVVQFSDKPIAVPALALTDLDGRPVTPDMWRGKVALINFWATWCGPCREEIPALIALQQHYKDSVVIVGLSIDT